MNGTQHTPVKQSCYTADIDGTLANHKGNRSPYDESKVLGDLPIFPVLNVINNLLYSGTKIIFVSGRSEGCRNATEQWLYKHLEIYDYEGCPLSPIELYMRQEGDRRGDDIIKEEIYDNIILPKYNVLGVFDDRMKVCRMLYKKGLFVFNCNQGLIEF